MPSGHEDIDCVGAPPPPSVGGADGGGGGGDGSAAAADEDRRAVVCVKDRELPLLTRVNFGAAGCCCEGIGRILAVAVAVVDDARCRHRRQIMAGLLCVFSSSFFSPRGSLAARVDSRRIVETAGGGSHSTQSFAGNFS